MMKHQMCAHGTQGVGCYPSMLMDDISDTGSLHDLDKPCISSYCGLNEVVLDEEWQLAVVLMVNDEH